MLDATMAVVTRLVFRGRERGYVTFDDINLALGGEDASPETIEDIMALLDEMGIPVIERDDAEDGEAAVEGPRRPLSPLPLQSGAEAPLESLQG